MSETTGHRRSIRLAGYDYAQAGAYFVTVCTQDRVCLFGDVVGGEMSLSAAGDMVLATWEEVPARYPGIETDAFVVMPNHLHGIVVLVGAGPCARPRPLGQPPVVAPTLSLPDVVHRFKTLTTKRYADGVKQHGWTAFPERLWQRNYYEHVIRDEAALERVRRYIAGNPALWAEDPENPAVAARGTTAGRRPA